MNIVISIFGGMLLTVLLYGAGRYARLSNFWAAVAAAGLPTLSYIAYAFASWPGLDVITLHVVAYPTISVLLFQLYNNKPGQEMGVHWVPKLLIAFFVVLTVLLGSFVYVAGNGLPQSVVALILPNTQGKVVHTGFSGVVQHGEEAAKTIAQHRAMDDRLAKLGWTVTVVGLDALGSQRSGEVKVLLRQTDGAGVTGQRVNLSLIRPGDPTPDGVPLLEQASGEYRANITLAGAGVWLAVIRIATTGKAVVLEHLVGQE